MKVAQFTVGFATGSAQNAPGKLSPFSQTLGDTSRGRIGSLMRGKGLHVRYTHKTTPLDGDLHKPSKEGVIPGHDRAITP
jgi:hypothetical protein